MASGGPRAHSGPPVDPNSGRSARRGLNFQALPNEGFQGEAPEWPLGSVMDETSEREIAIWRESWRTPQAAAWNLESWRWPIIAEYCRLKAVVEASPASSAALVGQLHRYREQLGLTPAGIRLNGWAIQQAEITPAVAPAVTTEAEPAPVRRLRA